MRNPLKSETIERISLAQTPVTILTHEEKLRSSLFAARTLMMNGKLFDDGDMWVRGWELANRVYDQMEMV